MKGDYVLTANDILSGGNFADTVAYGGWGLDDHNPDGFDGKESNYNQVVHNVYGIPYRCLYSENIGNLFFAGRNISALYKVAICRNIVYNLRNESAPVYRVCR